MQTFQACNTMTQEKTWANKLINFSLYIKTSLSRYSFCICLCLVSIVLLSRCFIGVGRGGGGCLPMFGVHCFVVQVLHRRRKRGGGAGGPPNNLRGGQPPPNNPPTFSFNFYVKQKKNQKRTKLKGKTK